MNWKHRINIRQFLTENEDHESVQECMNSIADVLEKDHHFTTFSHLKKFRSIPPLKDESIITPVDYANKLMDKLYDFCDDHQIWVAFEGD